MSDEFIYIDNFDGSPERPNMIDNPFVKGNNWLRFIEEEKQEIQLEQIDSILQFLSKSNNIGRIGIIGGEPTLHSNIEEVLNKFVSFSSMNKNIPIVIFSNGIHINRISKFLNRNCSCLINLNEPSIIGQEKWNKILFNLEKLKANGNI